ncbi:uncharacterized protein LOC103992581 isoform X1 [Musa acuminata AAA Group]|uniref:uncharacterized protein LOC103992581 isoform X1 n=1 Tax=Musa acuminata AAA Group TaxID=214697 RepID=UPI0031E38397
MSRCFPFPPPEYEKKTSSGHVDLLAEDKHKEKKHKKEKSDKGKREGKEKKDKDRSKDKHKEKKDRKERHKDKKKKDQDKDKLKTPYDRADKQTDSPNGDMVGECSWKAEAIKHSKSTEELGRKIKDGDKVPANRKVDNFSGPVEKSIGSFAAPAVFKERVPTDKSIPSSVDAPQGRIDGLERSADKIAISNQRRNEGLVSSHVSQKERSTSDKLAPDLNSTAQRGNGGMVLPLEKWVDSVPRQFEGPYPAAAMEIDNYKSNKVTSSSTNAVQRTTNGMGQPTQNLSTPKNVASIGLASKMEDRRDANKTDPNHDLMDQRRIDRMGRSVEKDANNRIKEEKARNTEREADDRREDRQRDKDHDKKKIKDKDKHKGKEKEKAKVKEKGEHKHKEQIGPRDGMKKDQSDSLDLKPLAPQRDNAKNYPINDNFKKRKEMDINGFHSENNMRIDKCPRTNPSSHLREENGRTLESSHIATVFPSVKPEAIRYTLTVKPVDNKEHKINGIAEAQPSLSGLTHLVAAKKGAAGKVDTSPHPDSMYLNQVYSIPIVDEWPEYDDQEWLFSSCHLQQKPKSKLGGNEVRQVWSEALKIEQEDVVALPYVVPY